MADEVAPTPPARTLGVDEGGKDDGGALAGGSKRLKEEALKSRRRVSEEGDNIPPVVRLGEQDWDRGATG